MLSTLSRRLFTSFAAAAVSLPICPCPPPDAGALAALPIAPWPPPDVPPLPDAVDPAAPLPSPLGDPTPDPALPLLAEPAPAPDAPLPADAPPPDPVPDAAPLPAEPDSGPPSAAGLASTRPMTRTCRFTLARASGGTPSSSNVERPLTSGPPDPPAPFAPTPPDSGVAGVASTSVNRSLDDPPAAAAAADSVPVARARARSPDVPVARGIPGPCRQPTSVTVVFACAAFAPAAPAACDPPA